MMRGFLIFITFLSVIFFPWPLTALLALVASVYVPLMPLAVGLFADTLYYAPYTRQLADALPLFTLYGALATGISLFIHTRLRSSYI